METFTRNGHTFQRWKIGASTYTACMERGARLMRWELDLPSGRREIIHWPDDADLADIATVPGGNLILFPFAGHCCADGAKSAWSDAGGVVRPMPRHGLAHQGRFQLTHATSSSAGALFHPDATARESYPFACAFHVRYTFGELALECELELANLDAQPIPWSAGHSFHFRIPWHPGLSRADYTLDIPAKKTWRHSADGKLSPFPGVPRPATLNDPALNETIHSKLKSNTATFGPKSGEEDIRIQLGDDPIPDTWASLVTWAGPNKSPFYCIAPWMGPPNSPGHKNGLHWIPPSQSEKFHVSLTLA
ncbi:MAG: hypothetical protein LBD14_05995 [Puniceicoccales bacterium]|jgi:galactose mutarotase-like enzyme|nr:hypothetical protein [Puniceicoccales bacterium]